METPGTDALVRLGDTDETVANPDDDIRGRDVKDKDGADLGKVKALLIDENERKVRLIEVASGGFLGIGQDTTFIPVDAITSVTADEVRLDQTREHVAGAPAYDPALIHERDTYGDVFGYYGFAPFWGGGYSYPDYPYYRPTGA
ncbi:PRC-barrel domain-containing protein [Microbacterium sp. AK031]|uniref:PRC-barrel domain-containing protein n=1 Tax=Microbacterium sp. AK031 TaxID=2723076 RepID=UPI002168C4E3|nr:PRC-barrel domain-containing protein [Microbacterium sp. AK031]MCS3844289.1 sporulation protein YlmC with PRC-barrel domain [Microbacterium sp. AK031]